MAVTDALPRSGWLASGFNTTSQQLSPGWTASSLLRAPALVDASSLLVADSHFVITALIAALAVIISTSWLSFLRRRRSLPPGPSPWPILGNLPDLGALPFRSLAKLSDRYGPILTVWFGSTPSVIISSPELAREVLKTKDKLCSSRPLPRTVAILTLDGKNIAFSPANDHLRKMRRLATLHLLCAKKLQESLPVREGEIRDMLDAIAADTGFTVENATSEAGAKNAADGAKSTAEGGIEMRRYLNRATLNNILRLTVGKHFSYASIHGAAGTTPKAILDAAMQIDWNARIAAMGGDKRGEIPGADAGAAAPATGPQAAAASATSAAVEEEFELSSLKEEAEGEVVFAIIEEGFALAGAFNLADYVPWLSRWDPQRMYARTQRLAPQLHGFMRACIEERRQLLLKRRAEEPRTEIGERGEQEEQAEREGREEQEAALVDTLFEIEGEGEDQMGKDEMMMLAVDMMMAGTDTTSKTVEWALAELVQRPDTLERLRAEVDAAYAKSASAAAETGAAGADVMVSLPVLEMPFLQAVLKETLRHHPVAPFLIPHLTTGSVALGGYTIPPNTMVQVNAWALAHDPTVWINSHEFDPTRFFDPAAPDVTGQNFSLLPFGSGRRGCLGTSLGLDLLARLLANFVLRFDFELPADVRAAGGVDMGETYGLTMAMAKPLRLVVRERMAVVAAPGA
ncbi:hypothetical protein CLOM_g17462 [Closterium sp. NIES-68]|nr:hypothetical protein CLOM_g17462 [Closterium sp. NIES-68]GJP74873.1 hypothetical protein CLOP_g5401 [Closterium sp. NIES-67]